MHKIEKNKLGRPLSDNDYMKADRLVNVALTRARGKVIVIADCNSMKSGLRYTSGLMLEDLLSQLKRNSAVVRGAGLGGLLVDSSVALSCVKASKATDFFIDDLYEAEQRIVLNTPCVYIGPDNAVVELRLALIDAAKDGVSVVVKGDTSLIAGVGGLENLDCVRADAFHPLCIIDGKVVWYGPPLLWGQVKRDTAAQLTACWRVDSREVAAFLEMRISARPARTD